MLNRLFLDNKFWNLVNFVSRLDHPITLKSLKLETETSDEDIESLLIFMNGLGGDVKIKEEDDKKYIVPATDKLKFQIDLEMSEWLSLQYYLLELSKNDQRYNSFLELKEKIENIKKRYKESDLEYFLKKQEYIEQRYQKGTEKREVLNILEQGIGEECLLDIKFHDKSIIQVVPFKVVYLEGNLSLVGESTLDRCILSVRLDEILSVEKNQYDQYAKNYSLNSVEDFIQALRNVNGTEKRLVLKIYSQENIDFNPPYHFLGDPFLSTNSNGDVIWAASVEASEDIFDWIISMGDNVEVLDPTSFKIEFLEYCEKKLEEEAQKKAA